MFQRAFRLFSVSGISVYLHPLWFIVAFYEISSRKRYYSSISWNIAEYLALFLIVLLHEFGHALACRQVGGTADKILLWPLGGVAYVAPPARPGATLWSIAAGPLVNVAIGLILFAASYTDPSLFGEGDLHLLVRSITWINLTLLVFNLLPVYPLDGGQILRSLLWFVFGRARSLSITVWLGIAGAIALIAFALKIGSLWLGAIAAYMAVRCWSGIKSARALETMEKLPRRGDYVCPSCSQSPQVGNFWKCTCGARFDTFASQAMCSNCGTQYPTTMCMNCRTANPIGMWKRSSAMNSTA